MIPARVAGGSRAFLGAFFSESLLTRWLSPSRLIYGDDVVGGVAFFIGGPRGADLFVR